MAPVLSRSSPRVSPYSRPSSPSASRPIYRISPLVYTTPTNEGLEPTVNIATETRKRPLEDDESTFSVSPDASTNAKVSASRPIKRVRTQNSPSAKITTPKLIIVTIPRNQALDFALALLYPNTARALAGKSASSPSKRPRDAADDEWAAIKRLRRADLMTPEHAPTEYRTSSCFTIGNGAGAGAPALAAASARTEASTSPATVATEVTKPATPAKSAHSSKYEGLERNCARIELKSHDGLCRFKSTLRLANDSMARFLQNHFRFDGQAPFASFDDVCVVLPDITRSQQMHALSRAIGNYVRTGNADFIPQELAKHIRVPRVPLPAKPASLLPAAAIAA
ncbi:uncharacterized protein JCM10292_002211 [Rhodotorula paludigena]|uniref:uncharacterized protein n=1 Tax=Rhodotorula paludigena TaxID=86838 RepID=UPI00317F5DAB